MDQKYWDAFYEKNTELDEPSSFAVFCLKHFLNDYPHKSIIEFGCGNGRDAFYFALNKFKVIGIDHSPKAIEKNNLTLKSNQLEEKLRFFEGEFQTLIESYKEQFSIIYSRFTMHAVNQQTEDEILNKAYEHLPDGGILLLEFRTINDPLMQQGESIGKYERITTHYRRFIDASGFVSKCIGIGFKLKYFVEKDNLSIYKEDNPVLARIVLEK